MNMRPLSARGRLWLGIAATLLVIVLWHGGAFDKPLSAVGLNAKTCIVVVSGNKLCGDDAKAWCNATDNLRRLAASFGDSSDRRNAQHICDEVRQ